MDAIAARGMAGLRMADVGERAGMSPGHILYYYSSKQRLLLETLRWSDDRLAERRARELPSLPDRARATRAFHRDLPPHRRRSGGVAALAADLGAGRRGPRGRGSERGR